MASVIEIQTAPKMESIFIRVVTNKTTVETAKIT